jgi:GTP-binding protein SAR1
MEGLWNWIIRTFDVFGYFSKKAKILFLGLDNAGKTTLLRLLKDDRIHQHAPTHHPNKDELCINNVTITAFDLGGHKEARKLWDDYFIGCDGIVFIIDTSDRERIQESAKEFQKLCLMENLPIAILGNKIDLDGAMSIPELSEAIGFVPNHLHQLFMCSIVQKTGYKEAFEWLSKQI